MAANVEGELNLEWNCTCTNICIIGFENEKVNYSQEGGYSVQKTLGDVPPNFSKFSQIWAKIVSNLRKFWKNQAISLKNLAKNWADWCLNGSLFLEKFV